MKKLNITCTTILLVLGWLVLSRAAKGGCPCPLSPEDTAYGTDALSTQSLYNSSPDFNSAFGYRALYSNATGVDNTATGANALFSNSTGGANTAVGFEALYANIANDNTATGYKALYGNITGFDNTADGVNALISNTTGTYNTASGVNALFGNTSGNNNTAHGVNALASNNGSYNTATGVNALELNTTGSNNTATGGFALGSNITGNNNTATGFNALASNTTINGVAGGNNTANGWEALFSNTIGQDNIALGDSALFSNTTGGGNVSTGDSALGHNKTGNQNTATGILALLNNTSGSGNIAVGASAGKSLTTGSNNIDIGNVGVAAEANTIRIGKSGTQQKAFIAGISGKTVASGVGVIINSSGQLGTVQSSARFKEAIKPMDKASEAILALEPVTFRYKHELDPDGLPQFGLVAEQVEKINSDLVVRDEDGKIMSVRYEAVNAMLLNEFLKEHRKGQEQERKVAGLEATVAQQQKQIETLAAGLQKVSAAVELNKPTPTQVADNR